MLEQVVVYILFLISMVALCVAVMVAIYTQLKPEPEVEFTIDDVIDDIQYLENCDNVLLITHTFEDNKDKYKVIGNSDMNCILLLDIAFFTIRNKEYWCFENELNLIRAMGAKEAKKRYNKKILYDTLSELENSNKPESEKAEWRELLWALID